jgi:hypothetical protein
VLIVRNNGAMRMISTARLGKTRRFITLFIRFPNRSKPRPSRASNPTVPASSREGLNLVRLVDAPQERSRASAVLVYTRTAAVAFLLVVAYTLFAKVPDGDIRDDWLHTILHVVTGIVAVSIGWVLSSVAAARVFTLTVGMSYGVLGIGGWFTDGLFLGREFAVPLTAADNIFHLLLAGGAAVAIVSRQRRSNTV